MGLSAWHSAALLLHKSLLKVGGRTSIRNQECNIIRMVIITPVVIVVFVRILVAVIKQKYNSINNGNSFNDANKAIIITTTIIAIVIIIAVNPKP